MKETVKLVEFIPGHTSEKSGKWVPGKVKDGNSREFTFAKEHGKWLEDGGVTGFIGVLSEIDFTETQNGRFTNRVITEIAHHQEPKPAEKAQGNGWKRDPAESSLILRQVALKAAVELAGKTLPWKEGIHATVLATADIFNDWLHSKSIPPSEQKAQPQPKGNYTAHLREGESLQDAAARAVREHDEMDLVGIPPADAADEAPPSTRTPYPQRETLRASGPARR